MRQDTPTRIGNLFVISGPSGAGKGTVLKGVMARVPDAWESISWTTRAPRGSEVDGVEYHFKTVEEFEELRDAGGLLEWACVHDRYYGTPRQPVEEHMAQGGQVILEIDVQGAFQVRENLPEAHLVFIAPPSLEELERRLRSRGTETADQINTRLANAKVELELQGEYDYVVVNDDLDTAVAELTAYIESKAQAN